ncbi:MAG: flavin reductase, partial [Treponema sp.]|nr:flavin reductase [Treponema sp.]
MESFQEVDLREAYTLIKSPAFVATKGQDVYNLTPYGWIMPMDYDPVTKVIFSSDPTHQCCQNIKRTKNFAVCIPENASDPIIEKCGSVSSPSADKFSMFNIHGEKAKKIDVLIPTKIISAWL